MIESNLLTIDHHTTLFGTLYSATDTQNAAHKRKEIAPSTASQDARAAAIVQRVRATARTRQTISATGGDGLVAAAEMMEPTVPDASRIVTTMLSKMERMNTSPRVSLSNKPIFSGDRDCSCFG